MIYLRFEFLRFLVSRLLFDRVLLHASSLSYVTLLSLVPLATVVFSALSIFPVFENLKQQAEDFIFVNFVPNSGQVVQTYFHEFVSNASGMTLVGTIVLVVVAILLVSSIERALNEIWRIEKNRRLVVSFSVYWVALTLGPVLIGTSIMVTSYLTSFAEWSTLTELSGFSFQKWSSLFFEWLPFLSSVLAFLLLFILVPHTRVKWQHALTGAVISAWLFELSKSGFALYINFFPSYQAIYGALAAIPILFVWVYISWVVVLVGAEVAASMSAFEQEKINSESSQQSPSESAIPSEAGDPPF